MNHLIHTISDHMNKDFGKYWPGFSKVAYALYDHEKVYLFNHPAYENKTTPTVIPRNKEEFSGADTIILYAEHPTAIVNMTNKQNIEEVYAILVHELFHGFQHLQGEQRFPNEVLGMTYPVSKENIELRNKERNYLYKAIFTKDQSQKLTFMRKLIQLREQRKHLLGDAFTYELAVETTEGPAWYVELLAKADIRSINKEDLFQQYLDPLLNIEDSNLHMRKSCYSAGLAICLLLEEYDRHWQNNFFTSGNMLYDYLLNIVEVHEESRENEEVMISPETEEIVEKITAFKEDQFQQFISQKGIHVFIEGDMSIKMFDPMNIVAHQNKMLHHHFIKLQIQQQEYFISQPVITYYHGKFTQVDKVHLVLSDEPQVSDNTIHLQGIGQIQGDIIQQNGGYYIQCN